MRKPRARAEASRIQRVAMATSWVISGMLALGAFFNAIANAIFLIVLPVALACTALTALAWLVLEIILAKKGIRWVRSGVQVRYRSLGWKTRAMFVGWILLLWVPTALHTIRGDQHAKYVTIDNVDAWYYSISSLESAMSDPSVPVDSTGVRIIPSDDDSQTAFMRLYQLRGHPVFELTIRNSHPTDPVEVLDVRVNLNRGQDWWGLNTQFVAPSRKRLVCGPMSAIKVKGTPYMENSSQRPAFAQLLLTNNPYDMVGAARITLATGGEVLTHRPFALSKRNIREYDPDDF